MSDRHERLEAVFSSAQRGSGQEPVELAPRSPPEEGRCVEVSRAFGASRQMNTRRAEAARHISHKRTARRARKSCAQLLARRDDVFRTRVKQIVSPDAFRIYFPWLSFPDQYRRSLCLSFTCPSRFCAARALVSCSRDTSFLFFRALRNAAPSDRDAHNERPLGSKYNQNLL